MPPADDAFEVAGSAADPASPTVATRVQEIIASAERMASELQQEVEAETARRAADVRLAAEQEAQRILLGAEQAAAAYLDECRRRCDAFAGGRIQRIAKITDELIAAGETIKEVAQVQDHLESLLATLSRAAEEAAREAARPSIRLPEAPAAGHDRPAEVSAETARTEGEARPPSAEPAGDAEAPDSPEHREAPKEAGEQSA